MTMSEKILLYHFNNQEIKSKIIMILSQLNIDIVEIKDEDVNKTIGYLCGIDNDKGDNDNKEIPEREMMLFFGLDDNKLTFLLDVFKQVGIPFIPLKAVVTPTNVDWTFYDLYMHAKDEYEMMYQRKLD